MNVMQGSAMQQSVLPSSGWPTHSSSSVPLRQQLRLQHRFSGAASRTQLHSVSVQQRHGRRERSFTPPQAFIWTQGMVPDQSGKTFIVTGSTSGMGFEIAKALVERNANVIIASRNKQKCDQVANEFRAMRGRSRVEAMQLDLSNFRSIHDFAENFKKTGLPLNCLVNCAGVFLVPHDHTKEGFEITVGTNHFGPTLLSHLLMDNLVETAKQTGTARCCFMSSTFEAIAWLNWDDLGCNLSKESGLFEYADSKILQLMLSKELNKRLKGTGVECFAANPGLVNTPLNHANPRGKGDSNKATTWLVELSTLVYGQQPWRGCRSLLRTATDPSLTSRGGTYYSPPYLGVLPVHINAPEWFPQNKYAYDENAWRRAYDQSLGMINDKLSQQNLTKILPVGSSMKAVA